jgi:hypothetical protein
VTPEHQHPRAAVCIDSDEKRFIAACSAMQGILASRPSYDPRFVAVDAVHMADLLVKQLEKQLDV